eukprot:1190668-Prymnesium_polylepis.2
MRSQSECGAPVPSPAASPPGLSAAPVTSSAAPAARKRLLRRGFASVALSLRGVQRCCPWSPPVPLPLRRAATTIPSSSAAFFMLLGVAPSSALPCAPTTALPAPFFGRSCASPATAAARRRAASSCGRSGVSASSISTPCCSMRRGPMPHTRSSSAAFLGRRRTTSQSVRLWQITHGSL